MPGSRLLLRVADDRFDSIDADEIFYAKAVGGDTVVRTPGSAPGSSIAAR